MNSITIGFSVPRSVLATAVRAVDSHSACLLLLHLIIYLLILIFDFDILYSFISTQYLHCILCINVTSSTPNSCCCDQIPATNLSIYNYCQKAKHFKGYLLHCRHSGSNIYRQQWHRSCSPNQGQL
jgi:hypothetical protein